MCKLTKGRFNVLRIQTGYYFELYGSVCISQSINLCDALVGIIATFWTHGNMPIFTCGHHFSVTYCHWDAAEHTKNKLITKITEHAKTSHSMDRISLKQLTFIDAMDLLRLKLQQMEADVTASHAIRASSSTGTSSDLVKQATMLRWNAALQTYSHDELEWMLIEEINMKNNCPLHLVVNGVRADFPVPRSCVESHCPHRFNCVLHR
ncbi:MAG: DUF1059 domain-containing protein [Candidatus Bathyarchaeota archaeon]|nr:MAG: DUF1059 domain-containing protein [Candidatus Bathyarchaeota archaeon]